MKKEDLKIGISLSGGGARAAVFHLGVLARLAEENLLENIAMTSTVSGGTLVIGLIYLANGKKWPSSTEFKKYCIPYVRKCLTEKDLQIRALLRTIFTPWNHLYGRAKVLSKSLQECWGIKCNLNEISSKPRWNINATTIESGKSWRFIPQKRIGDYVLNYINTPEFLLADAMGASAAVPFLIGSLILRTKKYKWFKYKTSELKIDVIPIFNKIHIWDGGVYDNLGVEPLVKFKNGCIYREEFNFLMVSDASKGIETGKTFWQSSAYRLLEITKDQVRSMRARILVDHFDHNKNVGVYFRIGNTVEEILRKSKWKGNIEEFSKGCLSKDNVNNARNYKTTLRKISIDDFKLIFKHGWEVTDTTLIACCPELFSQRKFNGYL
jgi:NTE family protein